MKWMACGLGWSRLASLTWKQQQLVLQPYHGKRSPVNHIPAWWSRHVSQCNRKGVCAMRTTTTRPTRLNSWLQELRAKEQQLHNPCKNPLVFQTFVSVFQNPLYSHSLDFYVYWPLRLEFTCAHCWGQLWWWSGSLQQPQPGCEMNTCRSDTKHSVGLFNDTGSMCQYNLNTFRTDTCC